MNETSLVSIQIRLEERPALRAAIGWAVLTRVGVSGHANGFSSEINSGLARLSTSSLVGLPSI